MEVGELVGEWDFDGLPENIRIGPGTRIERSSGFDRFWSTQDPGCIVGANCRIYTWTGFSVEPNGVIEIGDECVLVGAMFMCAERITIGNRVVISYNVTIADCDFHPIDPELRRADAVAVSPTGDIGQRPPLLSAPITIGDDVHLGVGAVVLKGVSIGAGARVGPGSVVTKDVPAGALIVGNPGHVADP